MVPNLTKASEDQATWITIVRLLRWDKPAGRLILMIPALWAVVLASGGVPPLALVGVIILGSLATSAAGCVINDLWDRDIDPLVERTKNRPLASRTLSIRVAIVVTLISLTCAAIFALYLNPLSFWLCVAAVPVIIGYPLAKRVFPVPQLVLALAWGFAVLISWTAVTGELEGLTMILWAATITWTLGFDTVYAMADRQDDLKIGINSSALFFGKFAPSAVALFYTLTAALLAYLAVLMGLHWSFWLAWGVSVVGWFWHYLRLKSPQLSEDAYGEMFRQNVSIGFILLIGMFSGCRLY